MVAMLLALWLSQSSVANANIVYADASALDVIVLGDYALGVRYEECGAGCIFDDLLYDYESAILYVNDKKYGEFDFESEPVYPQYIGPEKLNYVTKTIDSKVVYDIIYTYTEIVPIPAASWLFGSALAGLGWMRRKQTV
jgi:hypothetical protein